MGFVFKINMIISLLIGVFIHLHFISLNFVIFNIIGFTSALLLFVFYLFPVFLLVLSFWLSLGLIEIFCGFYFISTIALISFMSFTFSFISFTLLKVADGKGCLKFLIVLKIHIRCSILET